MFGSQRHLTGVHDHELHHAAEHGEKDRVLVRVSVLTSALVTIRAVFSYLCDAWIHRTAAALSTLLLACAGQLAALQPAAAQTEVPQGRAAGCSTRGIFAGVKVGQKVTLTDKNGAYEIGLLNEGSIGSHVVVEIGPEHVVLDDLVAVSRRWIPATSVRSVVWTRVQNLPR